MVFLFRSILLPLLTIVIEIYFLRNITNSFQYLFPKFRNKILKIVLIFLLCFFNLFLAYLLISGIIALISNTRVFVPENELINYLLTYPFVYFLIFIFQVCLFFIIIDILKLILLPFHNFIKYPIKKIEYITKLSITVFFIFYIPIRMIYDFNEIEINEINFYKKSLPKQLQNLKIVFVSDIQADQFTNGKRLENFINKINSINPDIVLIGGDLITSTPNYINTSINALSKIKSKYGIYTCIGDHDNWAYREDTQRSIREIKNGLEKYNIQLVDNDKRLINLRGDKILINFITHNYANPIPQKVLEDLSKDSLNSDLKIFLTHQPRQFLIDEAIKNNYDLFLAGHTHGGQVTFIFPFIHISPSILETKYVRGTFQIKNTLGIVTRGLGFTFVPFRYNSTPEITVINLNHREI